MKVITIALGGNALGQTADEQQRNIDIAVPELVDLITQGHKIILTHGNGPQVGLIYYGFEFGAAHNQNIPRQDLQECTAMSQGYIGFHLQKGIKRELTRLGMPWHVSTVVTQVEVDAHDPAFRNPSKPIGHFYSEKDAKAVMAEHPGMIFGEDAGRGWRRMVASPKPLHIVEEDSILNLLDHKFIVIACGGGGIPVVKDAKGYYHSVSAVVDKDYSAAKLANLVQSDYLVILTAIDCVSINFGKPDQREIRKMTSSRALKWAHEGHFAKGSMLPKILASVDFVRSGPDRKAVITSLDKAHLALNARSGTTIIA